MTDFEYEALERQWTPMLRKFASWRIPGMDYADIMQEMRIVLTKAQQRYDSGKKAKFITFLYTSCLNTALKLLYKAGNGMHPRKSTIPPALTDTLCDGDHGDGVRCLLCASQQDLSVNDDLSMIDLLSGASPEAKAIAGLVLYGNTSRRSWGDAGLTRRQITDGTNELKVLLKGG